LAADTIVAASVRSQTGVLSANPFVSGPGLGAQEPAVAGRQQLPANTETALSAGPSSQNSPPAGPVDEAGAPVSNCDTSQSSLYCVYTVQEGDTLGSIAVKFGIKGNLEEDVAPYELLVHSNKPDIVSEDDLLQIGQKLRIPRGNGVIHTVLRNDTLSDIASIYDVPVDDILAVAGNDLADPDSLSIGKEILIPNPKRFAFPVASSSPTPSGGGAAEAQAPSIVSGGSRSGSGFIWPTSGPISSPFGPGHPLGIDIDLFSNPNAPIGAAMAGVVTFAGGNACCSYGLYVVVDHGNGYQTLYAHLSKIAVSVGQRVSQGQLLGYGGRTGYATGNHLHFEVHRNGAVINPFSVLP